jgi:hypothetical protein
MSNQVEVLESFSSTLEKGGAVVAVVDGQVVGVATLILGVNYDLLQSNFLLSARVQMSQVLPDSLAEVDMVVVNPIFTHRKRDLLLGCLDILSCSVLFYALPPGTEKPDVLVEFSQVCTAAYSLFNCFPGVEVNMWLGVYIRCSVSRAV